MHILVGYATGEGQTRKIARFVADHLTAHGASVELLALEEAADMDLDRFDAAILAGSVHVGGYQRALENFAKTHALALAGLDDLFLSVSLTAAGDDPEDWEGLEKIVEGLKTMTGWNPDRVEHVAGAFRFTEYNFLEKIMMRRIAIKRDPGVDTTVDTEYTDWERVADLVDDWIAAIERH